MANFVATTHLFYRLKEMLQRRRQPDILIQKQQESGSPQSCCFFALNRYDTAILCVLYANFADFSSNKRFKTYIFAFESISFIRDNVYAAILSLSFPYMENCSCLMNMVPSEYCHRKNGIIIIFHLMINKQRKITMDKKHHLISSSQFFFNPFSVF